SISYVNSNDHFFVLNRDNGQPLVSAAVQVWQQRYDYKVSKYIREKLKLYKTDANGYFRIEKKTNNNDYYNNYYLDITYNNDHLYLDEPTNYYYYNNEAKPDKDIEANVFTWLFTDRSIYRPGQTAYFKGISILNNENNKSSIRASYKTKVYLFDANHQKIDSLNVETNEYGSFSGKFQLPQGVMNGQFSIQMESRRGAATIRVEEYKRPKFYVEYEALKGTYKVNDKIKITGVAKAYAGNNVDGAVVKYRVVRQPRFLYPWMFWKWWQPPTEGMEITHGETTTDKDGKFVVEFTAIPDLKIDKKFEPVFDYTVYADVTDINGETRSGEKSVSVSYKALLLKAEIDEKLPADSLKNISIRTENMNDEFEPAKIKVTITKLKEEKRLIRSRYWQRPDQFVMNKQEYTGYFHYDEYDNESDSKSWERDEVVFEKSDSSSSNSTFNIQHSKWTPGFYTVEIVTKDKNGEEVKDIKYIELFDEKSKQLRHPQYLWTEESKPIEPGEKTTIKLGTSADNLFIVQQLNRTTDTRQLTPDTFTFLNLNNEKRSFDFSATEADRGGYGVGYVFIKHNRLHQFSETIQVPWSNKDLQIEYATFRDKTLPGSEEKWKVKLAGYKNEKVAAEMLAGMYDASLDQFYPHYWYKPSIWSNYSGRITWNGNQNFYLVNSIPKYADYQTMKHYPKDYDRLFEVASRNFLNTLRREIYRTEALGAVAISDSAIAAAPGIAMNEVVVTGYATQKRKDLTGSVSVLKNDDSDKDGLIDILDQKEIIPGEQVQIRKNFNETAFFFPDLKTDENGAIEFSFTMPEALTKWKFQALAHTKDLAMGYSSKEIVTQKQLMVQPNAPRFMRQGDKMEFSAKVVNLTDKELTGQAELQLFNASTNQPVNADFKNTALIQSFNVPAGQSIAVKYPIEVPYQFNDALTWRIVAKASPLGGGLEGAFSDGEENMLPVLTNRMLVTESMPIHMRGSGTKNFTFEKLLKAGTSGTLQHHSLTVEYTSNPVWYAVQSLPYLMEYPYDCAEQTWNRYYANSLAAMIANSSPRIKQVFEQWKTKDTAALLSNLQKNQELKAVLLEETPWVLQAKTETEQKKNIALLFDMIRMSEQLNSSYEKLKQMQSENGGFVWFKGGPDDRYMTQYIITGIGHLKKLNAVATGQDAKLKQVLATAIPYLDKKIKEDYADLIKYKTDLKKYVPGSVVIQY
ncbi:MAG: alpha-2-macroglobulin, partial [Chitinophagaceae bacterium]|nr:alpha-2-macroglobulin [Chitinophagaceae bacterium]